MLAKIRHFRIFLALYATLALHHALEQGIKPKKS
jgi:hypothetical protein